MAKKEKSYGEILTAGFIKENPVLRLVLGTCPTLAVTTQAFNGLGMGAAATLVLIGSNAVISLLRNVIPDKVRIPAFITIIAGFVTIIQMLVKAFVPALDSALGIYLPLIVVNCIILGRAESFASKNKVLEIIGNGSWFGMVLNDGSMIQPMLILILPPGGFFVFGMLIALFNRLAEGKGKEPATLSCCNCPQAASCMKASEGGCE